MSRNTHHSEPRYIHVICNHLMRLRFTTHHRRGTQPQSSNNFHQSEVSRNMHHFITFCRSNIEIYWLEEADIHFTSKMHFLPALIKIIVQSEPLYTSFKMQLKLNVIKIHHQEWAVPHLNFEDSLLAKAVVQCGEWALADLTLMLYN